jgi:hypothetical protein
MKRAGTKSPPHILETMALCQIMLAGYDIQSDDHHEKFAKPGMVCDPGMSTAFATSWERRYITGCPRLG